MRVVKDPVQFVEGVIESLTHEEAQECFEVYANKIAKLMTEDECKELLKRFLHKGDSNYFIEIEMREAEVMCIGG